MTIELSSSSQSAPAAQIGRRRRGALLVAAASLLSIVGCAAVTNPVANGIPARMLPDDLRAQTREGYEQIPLTLLQQPPATRYILDKGDTLGIYIEGVIGSVETPPPVNIPDLAELPPSIGYPFPVRGDGTISLPYVGSIPVGGLTVEQAEQRVIDAYLKKAILRPDDKRILVTLMRPRSVRVLVLREDSSQGQVALRNESLLGLGTSETTIGGGRRSQGQVLELPAYQNDVLNALSRTGGLPGLESTQEIVIQRGSWNEQADPTGKGATSSTGAPLVVNAADLPRVTRIPLRIRPGEPITFKPEDVLLHNGDIVTVKGRAPAFFYTAGLLPASEIPLPMDYDLKVLEAVIKAHGPVLNGGLNANNLNGAVVGTGLGNPSPNLLAVLRKTPGGGQVMIRVDLDEAIRDPRQNLLVEAGDVLILQEVPDQALARYFSTIFRFNFFARELDHTDARLDTNVFGP